MLARKIQHLLRRRAVCAIRFTQQRKCIDTRARRRMLSECGDLRASVTRSRCRL